MQLYNYGMDIPMIYKMFVFRNFTPTNDYQHVHEFYNVIGIDGEGGGISKVIFQGIFSVQNIFRF